MNDRNIRDFWFGFAVALTVLACSYWLWRRQREVVPEPLVLFNEADIERAASSTQTVSDSLEEIRGIGPVSARRLNEAGIFTFSQLAETAPEKLQEVTGVTRWDPSDWITEAQRLADGG